jgi:hypothetical protein
LTLALFLLAVYTNEWEERFLEPHFITGWILMGLVMVQVLVGIFLPHVETATTTTAEKMEKSDSLLDIFSRSWNAVQDGSIRAIWEVCHKWFTVKQKNSVYGSDEKSLKTEASFCGMMIK